MVGAGDDDQVSLREPDRLTRVQIAPQFTGDDPHQVDGVGLVQSFGRGQRGRRIELDHSRPVAADWREEPIGIRRGLVLGTGHLRRRIVAPPQQAQSHPRRGGRVYVAIPADDGLALARFRNDDSHDVLPC
jgi:hypothetical protein